MMNRLIHICFIIFGLTGCQNQIKKSGLPEVSQPTAFIQNNLKEYISTNYPEYSFPTTNRFINNIQSFKSDTLPPYLVVSDFNGDKSDDYCILLTKANKMAYLFSFFSLNDGYQSALIDSFEIKNDSISIVLNIAEKGIWESSSETVEVQNNGITVELIDESMTWSYFWKDGRIIQFFYD